MPGALRVNSTIFASLLVANEEKGFSFAGKDSMIEHEREKLLHRSQLAFIGKMLMALTQKIPHHLAALQASAGRLATLLEQAHQEKEQDNPKLTDLLSTIERYVKILDQKTQHLNQLGQRMGRQLSTFNPGEVVQEAVLFSTRLAHLREISLRLEVEEPSPTVYGDSTCVHFLVSILIDTMLERMGEGGQVIVNARPSEKGFRISVAGHGTLAPISDFRHDMENRSYTLAQKLAVDLKGHLEPANIQGDTRLLALFLPVEQDVKEF